MADKYTGCQGCNGCCDSNPEENALFVEAYLVLLQGIVEKHDGVFHLDETTGEYQFDVPKSKKAVFIKELNATFDWDMV